jgi:hypothetical protein
MFFKKTRCVTVKESFFKKNTLRYSRGIIVFKKHAALHKGLIVLKKNTLRYSGGIIVF